MRPVLFTVPFVGWSVFGFGVVLFVTLLLCIELATRMLRRQGGNPEMISELIWWTILPGIVGARLFYIIEYRDQFHQPLEFLFIWRGGLVIYGAAIGGLLGFIAYAWVRKVPLLWVLDLAAPAIVLGAGLGRFGCLLNGCCYGDYCDEPWAIRFPAGSPPFVRMVDRGYQSWYGFVPMVGDRRVLLVEPETEAARAGLVPGDEIVVINGRPVEAAAELRAELAASLGDHPLELAIRRRNGQQRIWIRPPRSLPVHPTQVYSAIDGILLFLVLWSYYPLRRRDGEVISMMAIGYSFSRFVCESLRFDEPPMLDGLTIAQNISVLLFVAGVLTLLYTRIHPGRYRPAGPQAALAPTHGAPA